MSEPFVVAACMPVYREIEFDASTSWEALALGWDRFAPPHWILKRAALRGQPVMDVRNELYAWAAADQGIRPEQGGTRMLDEGGPPADVILWQDSDVSPFPYDYLRLVSTLESAPADVAMIGAPCVIQLREGQPDLNVSFRGFEPSRAECEAGRVVEVAAVGFGMVACRAAAYAAMEFPWHTFEYGPGGLKDKVGEDIGWCDRARLLGFSIFAHGGMRVGHTFPRKYLGMKKDDAWVALSLGASPERKAP